MPGRCSCFVVSEQSWHGLYFSGTLVLILLYISGRQETEFSFSVRCFARLVHFCVMLGLQVVRTF
uniref:Uncharacterized protein n=1 Tax=Arundo donax TaxID=35708 RepID=A0A0A8YNJ9_ARUDO